MPFDVSNAFTTIQRLLNDFLAVLPTLVIALIVLALFFFTAQGFKSLVSRVTTRRQRHRNLGLVLGRLSQWGTVLVGVLVALILLFPSFQVGDMVQLLGISGVAIGFAFRDILQNFLAGILLLVTEPFRIGDQIVVGTFEDTVEEIQTHATMIKTYDGRRIVIPNAALFTDSVMVNTTFEYRRLEYDVGIGVSDDIDRAKALMLAAMRSVEGVLQEPAPDVLVVKLADFSVQLRAHWWITPPRRAEALDIQDRVLMAMKTALSAHGIDLPFPTQQILFHDQTEVTDGNRTQPRKGWPVGQGEVAPQSRAEALGKWPETRETQETHEPKRYTNGGV